METIEKTIKKETLILSDLDEIAPTRMALAWENFIKRCANGMKENEAREILIEELLEYKKSKKPINPNSSLINENVDQTVAELKKYLKIKLDLKPAGTIKLGHGEFEGRFSFLKLTNPEEFKDLERSFNAFSQISKDFIKYADAVPDIKKSRDLSDKFLDTIVTMNGKISNAKQISEITEAYEKAAKEIETLIKNP